MAGKRPVIYWDTNVFVHWLNGSNSPTLESTDKDGIAFWYDLVDAREAILVTSAITFLEVSEHRVGRENFADFMRLARGRGVVRAADWPVMREASRLRDMTMKLKDDGDIDRIICVPDAIHLATAAVEKCEEFHTFDKNGRHQCFGLLPFDGKLTGYKPRICKPAVDAKLAKRSGVVLPSAAVNAQATLFDAVPETGETEGADGQQLTEESAEAAGPQARETEHRSTVGPSGSEDHPHTRSA